MGSKPCGARLRTRRALRGARVGSKAAALRVMRPDATSLTDRMWTLYLRGADRWLWRVAATLVARGGSIVRPRRDVATRPLIVRPGGMGDLILLCVAIEDLDLRPQDFEWVIERRSVPWARHLGLAFVSYDATPLRTQWRLAGRYTTVVNTEQRYGLSQATALLARGRDGRVFCFDTNVAAG